jgi:DNA-directed RNA polymerase specialized sigma24 family protein
MNNKYWTEKEEELVKLIIQENDKAKKDQLVNQLYPKIKLLCEGVIKGHINVEFHHHRDLINDCSTQAVIAIDKFNPEKRSTAYSYLSAVIKFYCIDFSRRQKKRTKRFNFIELTSNIDSPVDDNDEFIVQELDEATRQIFIEQVKKRIAKVKVIKDKVAKAAGKEIYVDVIVYLNNSDTYSIDDLFLTLIKKHYKASVIRYLRRIGIKPKTKYIKQRVNEPTE